MTEEEKELFIALCGYLPYETKIQCNTDFDTFDDILTTDYIHGMFFTAEDINIIPYLRTMDSMTTEEKIELCTIAYAPDEMKTIEEKLYVIKTNAEKAADFYNRHHLDYRGLIPMGLAIEAPEGLYKIE